MTFHVAYACDENYIEQTMVSMASLMEHNQTYKIVIYLIESKIGRESLQKICHLVEQYKQSFICIALDDLLKGIDLTLDERHPKTIYAKLFLDQVCEADRILYLDSDTVITSSLEDLWKMDFQDAYIAGVAMPYTTDIKRKLGLTSEMDYFCDGIVLINLKAWRNKQVAEQCREYIMRQKGNPYMLSEGVINAVAGECRITLPPKYNLMSTFLLWNAKQIKELFDVSHFYTQEQIEQARKNPVIIHYLNELYIRPWYRNSDHPYREEYMKLREKIGWDMPMESGSRSVRTKGVIVLNKVLPFSWFCRIYRLVQKRSR